MYNFYDNREFKYSFEDWFIDYVNVKGYDWVLGGMIANNLKALWNYLEEAKTKYEFDILTTRKSELTPEEKQWLTAINDKHYISRSTHWRKNKTRYDQFVEYERKMLEMEEMYWDSLIFT